ncbi:CRISPR-associated protein [Limnoraphis robusta CS-951]|uniref:CRISPR-associated protein n=1 Tax=Limnoraphis robusta CS-951 TaxID=1637645 RepID=A0A0F5Y9A4_9CYAN|nr:CRISPR-associated protein [Limnoraphis robusta CS-951]
MERIPRRAIAPYNFVELPEKVVEAQPLPEQNCYHNYSKHLINGETVKIKRQTGRIECTLTTESPLYTRCGWSPEDFAEYGETPFKDLSDEIQKLRANFFINPATNQPVIPGSSIRGMLRTLVEIVSFSKIERVSGHQRLFFRAVGSNPKKESLGKEYKQYVNPDVKPEIVKAGYLIKNGETWLIQPAEFKEGKTFAWAQENSLDLESLNLQEFNSKKYKPKYIPVSYTNAEVDQTDRAKRLFAHDVDLPDTYSKKGVLVTSGNMKQTDDDNSPRCNHCIVFPVDKKAKPLPIDDTAIEHYRNALTDFQKASPFNKDWGVLQEDHPVFYYHDGKSETVGFFGQSPNFRIPYSPEGNGHATTVLDFIPKNLRELALIDLADAIFGWVKQESESEKLPQDFLKQRAGRVCVTDGLYESNQNGIWYSETPVTPQILSEPKPSYFPHYLVQPNADQLELKHYASEPIEKTVIRGHKLYWQKGSDPDFKLPPPKKVIGSPPKVSDTQTTLIKPVNKGVTFKFDIHFENLSDVELGALLWVLDIAQNDNYRLSLGMGKPLGLGAVKIEPILYLSNRKKRYENLFDSKNSYWQKGETETNKDISDYVSKFENYMLEKLDHTGNFRNLCRIQMLLAMLSWPGIKDVERNTRYMEIERDCSKHHIGQCKQKDKKINEYKERPVLPNPLDVMGIKIECDRPFPSLSKKSIEQQTELFLEDQEVDAKVVDIQVKEGKKLKTTIIYEIQGSDCSAKEETYKPVSLAVGDILKVCIVKAQGKSIRKVKRV